ncbi:hypothetical protein EBR57_10525, partial [bacterium]|nr:hypothetical protein [bacterium]
MATIGTKSSGGAFTVTGTSKSGSPIWSSTTPSNFTGLQGPKPSGGYQQVDTKGNVWTKDPSGGWIGAGGQHV